jgi:hypothetical protein
LFHPPVLVRNWSKPSRTCVWSFCSLGKKERFAMTSASAPSLHNTSDKLQAPITKCGKVEEDESHKNDIKVRRW